jgi:hypothetical protein
MEIPYTERELQLALIGIRNKAEEIEGILEKIEGDFNTEDISEKKILNRVTAEYNGISVEALISSPNYETLIGEYKISRLQEFVNKFKEVGYTDKEGWGIVALALGLIK